MFGCVLTITDSKQNNNKHWNDHALYELFQFYELE